MATLFGVSESWVRRIKQVGREWGRVAAKTTRNRKHVWEDWSDWLQKKSDDRPAIYLRELQADLKAERGIAKVKSNPEAIVPVKRTNDYTDSTGRRRTRTTTYYEKHKFVFDSYEYDGFDPELGIAVGHVGLYGYRHKTIQYETRAESQRQNLESRTNDIKESWTLCF